MLEILALWALTTRIGKIVEARGHKGGWYKVLAVALWIGCELIGAIIGASISKGDTCTTYGLAIAGAAIGAGISVLIANSVSVNWQASPRQPRIDAAESAENGSEYQPVAPEGQPDKMQASARQFRIGEIQSKESDVTKQPVASKRLPQKSLTPITTCPNCKMRVIPKPDGTCPSCQSKIL